MKFRLKGWGGALFIFIFVLCVSQITLFIVCFLHCLFPCLYFELVLGPGGYAVGSLSRVGEVVRDAT